MLLLKALTKFWYNQTDDMLEIKSPYTAPRPVFQG